MLHGKSTLVFPGVFVYLLQNRKEALGWFRANTSTETLMCAQVTGGVLRRRLCCGGRMWGVSTQLSGDARAAGAVGHGPELGPQRLESQAGPAASVLPSASDEDHPEHRCPRDSGGRHQLS